MNEANNLQVSGRQANVQSEVTILLQKYNNIFQMLLIPIYALFAWLFLARRRKINFAETIVLHTASSAQTNTLAILTTSIFFIGKNNLSFVVVTVASLAVMIFSFTICYRQFFKISKAKSIIYGVLVFFCTYVVQIILTAVLIFIYLLISNMLR